MRCKNIGILSFLIFSLCFFISCEEEPDFPDEPIITFNSFSQMSLDAPRLRTSSTLVNDSFAISIDFTDGDGDIGSDDNPIMFMSYDVFDAITDSVIVNNFSIPVSVLPQRGTSSGIEGTITGFFANSTQNQNFFCDSDAAAGAPQVINFSVFIVDNAGNQSNVITTPSFQLNCF